jgi:hypothetical protein
MYGASGSIAAVAKEQCLCDISCCLAMGQRRLQGSSSWNNIRTLIKFHVVLNKSALECYMSLKEGWGASDTSYEPVCQWMNTIQNGRKDRQRPSWCSPKNSDGRMPSGKRYLSLNVHSIFDKSKLASHTFEEQRKIDRTNKTILQSEPKSIHIIWQGNMYVIF